MVGNCSNQHFLSEHADNFYPKSQLVPSDLIFSRNHPDEKLISLSDAKISKLITLARINNSNHIELHLHPKKEEKGQKLTDFHLGKIKVSENFVTYDGGMKVSTSHFAVTKNSVLHFNILWKACSVGKTTDQETCGHDSFLSSQISFPFSKLNVSKHNLCNPQNYKLFSFAGNWNTTISARNLERWENFVMHLLSETMDVHRCTCFGDDSASEFTTRRLFHKVFKVHSILFMNLFYYFRKGFTN